MHNELANEPKVTFENIKTQKNLINTTPLKAKIINKNQESTQLKLFNIDQSETNNYDNKSEIEESPMNKINQINLKIANKKKQARFNAVDYQKQIEQVNKIKNIRKKVVRSNVVHDSAKENEEFIKRFKKKEEKDFIKIVIKNIISSIIIYCTWLGIAFILMSIYRKFRKSTIKILLAPLVNFFIMNLFIVEPATIFVFSCLCWWTLELKYFQYGSFLHYILTIIISPVIARLHNSCIIMKDLDRMT